MLEIFKKRYRRKKVHRILPDEPEAMDAFRKGFDLYLIQKERDKDPVAWERKKEIEDLREYNAMIYHRAVLLGFIVSLIVMLVVDLIESELSVILSGLSFMFTIVGYTSLYSKPIPPEIKK